MKRELNIIDKSWTLFLDRDGVINEKRDNDYVKNWDEFKFKDGALQTFAGLGKLFGRIFIVTNQRGVGLGLMTEKALKIIHDNMHEEVNRVSGRIDQIYYCIEIDDSSECRKPNVGMGLRAKKDFPEIEFSKSIMVGDSLSDMIFGEKLGMQRALIKSEFEPLCKAQYYDLTFHSLYEFSKYLFNLKNI